MSQAEYRRESSYPADADAISGERGVYQHSPTDDLIEYLKDYARERPEIAAMWCFGIGFILGWKLKPW